MPSDPLDALDPTRLPHGLPRPTDDGASRHLPGQPLPDFTLPSTSGIARPLPTLHHAVAYPGGSDRLAKGVVLFFYPRTGIPGQPPSLGFQGEDWDSIPGARGCTPHSCGFRDLHAEFARHHIAVFGISTSTTDHQHEFQQRQHIPFEQLSDSQLLLTRALNLPTFQFPVESGGPNTLLQRMAWYAEPDHADRLRILKVWYPVFPPNENAQTVLAWLDRRAAIRIRPATPSDEPFMRDELTRNWGGTQIWSIGRGFDAHRLPAFIAELKGEPVGLTTYDINSGGYQCEVVTLSSRRENAGAATRLLEAVEFEARRAGCTRLFLTTTNDNTKAIGFYQTRGWRLAALHKANVEEARKRKPHIPLIGHRGIIIRDELELELWLE